jgi:hypothetical protein
MLANALKEWCAGKQMNSVTAIIENKLCDVAKEITRPIKIFRAVV